MQYSPYRAGSRSGWRDRDYGTGQFSGRDCPVFNAGILFYRDWQNGGLYEGTFLDRLYGEYQEYRASLLGCTNTEIFNRCYEIDAIVNFYEILQEKAERMSDGELEVLLRKRDILADLYSSWREKSDSAYTEMAAHVEEEMKNIITGAVTMGISENGKEG